MATESHSLLDLISSAPVLPAKATVQGLLDRDVLSDMEHATAERLRALLEQAPMAASLVAGVVAHAPFLAHELRHDGEALIAHLTQAPDERFAGLVAEVQQAATGLKTPMI